MHALRPAARALRLAGLLSSLAVPAAAQAVPEARPCRPLFTTTAGLTEPGVVELEAGLQGTGHRDGTRHGTLPFQFNLGLSDWVDLRVGSSGHNIVRDPLGQDVQGCGDPLLGGQLLLARQARAGVDLGLAVWHKFAVSRSRGCIASGATDDTAFLVLTRTTGRWAFDLNLGANWIGHPGGGRLRQPALSCTATCAFAGGWNASLDTYALGATAAGPRTVSSILALSRDLSPGLTVDVAVEAGWTREAPRLALNVGLVWRLGRWRRR